MKDQLERSRKYQKLKTQKLVLCALFAALIAAGAFIQIPIPVIPLTMQFLFTNLAALTLGKRWGAASAGVYVSLGLLGLPVFTGGGGIGYVLRPTFGYLIGFIVGNYVCGWLLDKAKKKTFSVFLLSGIWNLLIVYAFGMVYYALISAFYLGTPVPFSILILRCLLLTAPGDLISCILDAIVMQRLLPVLQRSGG